MGKKKIIILSVSIILVLSKHFIPEKLAEIFEVK